MVIGTSHKRAGPRRKPISIACTSSQRRPCRDTHPAAAAAGGDVDASGLIAVSALHCIIDCDTDKDSDRFGSPSIHTK